MHHTTQTYYCTAVFKLLEKPTSTSMAMNASSRETRQLFSLILFQSDDKNSKCCIVHYRFGLKSGRSDCCEYLYHIIQKLFFKYCFVTQSSLVGAKHRNVQNILPDRTYVLAFFWYRHFHLEEIICKRYGQSFLIGPNKSLPGSLMDFKTNIDP